MTRSPTAVAVSTFASQYDGVFDGSGAADGSGAPVGAWTAEELGERAVSDKKVRRVRRDVGQGPSAE